MTHLLDFFDAYVRGRADAVRYDDGIRCWSYSFDQVRASAEMFAQTLAGAGLRPGDWLVIWSDNRPEWLTAFWGCMLRGLVVVPLDAKAPPDLVRRVVAAAGPRALVVGDGLDERAAAPVPHIWRLRDLEWVRATPRSARRDAPTASLPTRATVGAATTAEIVFTSGTTGDPKGVVITHGNILANIAPLERVAVRYRRYIWPLRPLRLLGLLPLSHMFGQALSVFVPPLIGATTVFVRGYEPREIAAMIRRHRITLAITVPRLGELVRRWLEQVVPDRATPPASPLSVPRRLWRYRQAHRLFGWRFLGFVVGGARLDADLEEFWRRHGFAVIQGYGLTETAPIVAWNDPFRIEHGTVGRPLEGVEVRIAPDGEVLVRGPSVTTGYWNAPADTQAAFEGGWFHTGDLGEFDPAGNLRILDRKKDVIVTADGLHVHPEDVERGLEAIQGVREAAVVGGGATGADVHAVLVLTSGADGAAVIRQANAALASHQRIRAFSTWPGQALPRTEATRKLKRDEIRRWVTSGAAGPVRATPPAAGDIERVLATYAHGQPVGPETTLNELGLSSLDRIELALSLEGATGVALGETVVAESTTVADVRRALDEATRAAPVDETRAFPRWSQRAWATAIRSVTQAWLFLPLARVVMRLQVTGLEHVRDLHGPVIFAANHQSLLDTPAVLLGLPLRWRRRLAVAMGTGFFDDVAAGLPRPAGRLASGLLYDAAVLFFNGFPLPEAGPGARATLRYAGELASRGVSILLFPEGQRTERGEIRAFRAGVGMMAARLQMPVVPVRLVGADRVMHRTWRWPRPGPVQVSFGAPLACEGHDYAAFARRVEAAVRDLSPP